MTLSRIVYCCLIACLAGCASTPPPASSGRTSDTYLKQGDDYFQKKKYEEAINQWKRAKESGGAVSREIGAMVDLRIADAQFENESYIEAAASYESFQKFHPNSVKAPYAVYRQALCNYKQINGIDRDQTAVNNSVTMFENFLKQYPASEYTTEARVKLVECIDMQARYEIYIGRFYFRSGQYKASAKRLEECIARYPQAPSLDEAFDYLEKAYLKSGEKDKARETFNRLLFRFPTSKYLKEAGNRLK